MLSMEIGPNRLSLVRDGKKTKTFRDGVRSYTLGDGVLINYCDKNDYSFITITSVKAIRVANLKEEDLIGSEYGNHTEFMSELSNIYPNFGQDSMITIVEFKLQQTPQLSRGVQRGA